MYKKPMEHEKHEIRIIVDPKDIPEWYGGIDCKCEDMQTMTTTEGGEVMHGVKCTCNGSGIGCDMKKQKIGVIDLEIPFRLT